MPTTRRRCWPWGATTSTTPYRLIQRALDEALRSRDADSICRAYVNYSDTLRQCGRFEEAVEMADRGVAFTASTGMRLTTGLFISTNGAEAKVSLGRLLEVIGALDDLPPEMEYDGHTHTSMVRTWALIRLGRPDGVAEVLDTVSKGLVRMADTNYQAVEYRNRAELAFLVGDVDAAVWARSTSPSGGTARTASADAAVRARAAPARRPGRGRSAARPAADGRRTTRAAPGAGAPSSWPSGPRSWPGATSRRCRRRSPPHSPPRS